MTNTNFGQALGNLVFQLLPALPHEGPPGPRGLAKALYPTGFNPLQPIPLAGTAAPVGYQPAPTMVPPVGATAAQPAAPNQVRQPLSANQIADPQPAANQVINQPMRNQQPRPIRGITPIVQSDPGPPKAIRMHISERRGM